MSEYKTLDQFFPDGKPDGRKFIPETYKGFPHSSDDYCFQPFYKSNALFWYGLTGKGVSASFYGSNLFKEYVPPRKTKKITLYKPIIEGSYGGHFYSPDDATWHTDKDNWTGGFYYSDSKVKYEIKGFMTMEAEIEE